MFPKNLCGKGLIPNVALLVDGETLREGPNGRSSGQWESALEGDSGSLTLPFSLLHLVMR